MNGREEHDRAVQKLADEYARKGFQVQKEAVLPFALGDGGRFRADILAERGDEHHVVEVTVRGVRGVRGEPQARRWDEIARQVRARPGWHFKIVPVERDPLPLPDPERIEAELANAEALLDQDKLAAALLLAAAAFEASARRRLLAEGAQLSNDTPAALVEHLVSEGHVEQEEFVPLRDAIELRNTILHGHLDQLPEREAVKRLVTDARRLLHAA
ncbi:uncharacterized protein SOCE26_046550 [Sorangium cellulosum]|uniref:REase AHJR-like domain-containing protein n=1 Tax=Sorangium cellulosum TaxID=56 RepID=A0A2L0EV91_SORCE|nr:hypothetical protein [Sorangium cellulosum]AUX43211.1 uncharacterized protein SOCE26_046550 [Sorangium cellulosum]